jgi:hypothetical protein
MLMRHRHTAAAVFEEMDHTIGLFRQQRQQVPPQGNVQVYKSGEINRRRSFSAAPTSSRFPKFGYPRPQMNVPIPPP